MKTSFYCEACQSPEECQRICLRELLTIEDQDVAASDSDFAPLPEKELSEKEATKIIKRLIQS